MSDGLDEAISEWSRQLDIGRTAGIGLYDPQTVNWVHGQMAQYLQSLKDPHVMPNDDIIDHDLHCFCECHPSVDGGPIWIHNAADGRD